MWVKSGGFNGNNGVHQRNKMQDANPSCGKTFVKDKRGPIENMRSVTRSRVYIFVRRCSRKEKKFLDAQKQTLTEIMPAEYNVSS